jgi:hypothetical protein
LCIPVFFVLYVPGNGTFCTGTGTYEAHYISVAEPESQGTSFLTETDAKHDAAPDSALTVMSNKITFLIF